MIERQFVEDDYAIYEGDCIEVMRDFPDNCMGLSVYSPPFANDRGGLYQYSSDDRDLSNNRDMEEFLDHYEFVVEQQHRITMPGRMNMIHCMDVPSGNSGKDFLIDFPSDLIEMHVRCRNTKCKESEFRRRKGLCGHGWFEYTSRYDVWKEPLGVRNRLMLKNLAHKTIVDDASKCANAGADYLLGFRKRGKNPDPVAHPNGLTEYAGSRHMPIELLKYKGWEGKQTENRFSHWIWRQYASSFWDDVRIDNVLPFREAKDDENEKHVHPLQLDVIERAVTLWSNPGDRVWTPFAGVGSEVYTAVKLGRKGIGAELKGTYFSQMIENLKALYHERYQQQELF